MSTYLVVSFENEDKAYEGTRALKDLHGEGSITLYAFAVLTKDAGGRLALKEEQDEGPIGTAIGSLVGGFIGIFGGPVGMAVGAMSGALIGSFKDLNDAGVGTDFLEEVGRHIQDADAVLVAEVSEEWTTPIDSRMEAIGGTVHRQLRTDVEDAQFDREIDAWNAEMDRIDAEMTAASDDAKAKLQAKKQEIQAKIEAAKARAKTKKESISAQATAKINALKAQAETKSGEVKAAIERRIEAAKAYHAQMSKDLGEAWGAVKDAARPD